MKPWLFEFNVCTVHIRVKILKAKSKQKHTDLIIATLVQVEQIGLDYPKQ